MSPPHVDVDGSVGRAFGMPEETAVPPNSPKFGRCEHRSITSVPTSSSGTSSFASMMRVPFQSGFDASPGVAYAGGSLRCAGMSQSQYGSRNSMSPISLPRIRSWK